MGMPTTTSRNLKVLLLATAGVHGILSSSMASAQEADAGPASSGEAAETTPANDEIVVTARSRSESLMRVPVAITALTGNDLSRGRADSLISIGQLVPGVIIGATRNNGGASIGIRGISSPANTAGFEQAVSVAIDGVQTSNGKVGQLGFFDLAQVEVLKGPQALFFGKNSEAGVISVKTAMPTSVPFASLRASYEAVADEKTVSAVVSGPLTETLKGRLALQYRQSTGWLYNDARARTNPFVAPQAPAGSELLPGASDRRVGDTDYQGRLTLAFDPSPSFSAVLKIFGERNENGGAGVASQVVGCTGPNPVTAGVLDPNAECKANNHLSSSDLAPVISQSMPRGRADGRNFGNLTAWISSLALRASLGDVTLSSLTGYNDIKIRGQFGFDQSAFSQLVIIEQARIREFSQELRVASDFSGPLNFVVGGYFQKVDNFQYNDLIFSTLNYTPANGRFDSVESQGSPKGRTYSAFGQLTYALTDQLEFAGGVRWTEEKKRIAITNLYGIGNFNVSNTIFPGESVPNLLNGRVSGDNISPEATLTWRPDSDHTVYIAYKTGYKSGGIIQPALQVSTRTSDVEFGPERVRGGEIGAKGLFLDRRLNLSATAFLYRFKGLQVSIYNAVENEFKIDNAALLKQEGVEVAAKFQVTPRFEVHGALTYVNNRYSGFTGQCYAFSFPVGTTPATAVPPPNCSLVPGAGLTLQQDYDGRAPARSPKVSAEFGTSLTIPAGSHEIELTADGTYSGSYFGTDNLNPSSFQDEFFKLNASASIQDADGKWRLSLIGRNLTNVNNILFSTDRPGGSSIRGIGGDSRATVTRGRQVALQLDYQF